MQIAKSVAYFDIKTLSQTFSLKVGYFLRYKKSPLAGKNFLRTY